MSGEYPIYAEEDPSLRQELDPARRALIDDAIRQGLSLKEYFLESEISAYYSDPDAYDGGQDAA